MLRFGLPALVLLTIVSCTSTSTRPMIVTPPDEQIAVAVPPPAQGAIIPADAERLYPNERLRLCSKNVSNAPPTDGAGNVVGYSRLVVVDGRVPIVTAPANNACVTSGFGMRWGRPHKGIDVAAVPASRVFSGGAGYVVEAGFNGGYGLAILIDHGQGVYTRYAHLRYLEDNIQVGTKVYYGQPLGLMGKSGQVTGIHLHYEILTGQYQPGVWGRGLTPRDPFSFPAWVDPYLAS